jgi:predicted PolB exonuclease-like 3'-5' exonuclease
MHPLNSILFLDIETVPQYASYDCLPEEARAFWNKKACQIIKDKEVETPESVYPKAGMFAEFGRIVCISVGIICGTGVDKKLVIKSFCCEEEKDILVGFCELLQKWSGQEKVMCAHNGKEFDFPFLCRRMIINKMPIPQMLQVAGKKPWEICHLDTMELWKFGDHKNYTTLNLLAYSFGIATPKDDIDGSMVWKVYWDEHDLTRIVTYCQKDVITVAQVYLRMQGECLIKAGNIEIKPGYVVII